MADAEEKVLDARCFKLGEGRTGFGLVNRGLGLRGICSSTPFLLRPPFTVGRAVVVRRRFGLSQLMSLGISLLLFVDVCCCDVFVYARVTIKLMAYTQLERV